MFQHFVLTRFNLKRTDWETTTSKTKVLTDSWMENRLKLFERYCFSSLKAQTEQNFTWLVFFDISTPQIFRDVVTRLNKEFVAFTPIFINGMEEFLPSIKQEIKVRCNHPYLITSRLDNDDSLHQDYIKKVQAEFSQQDFMAIDFVDGFTLQVEPKVRFAKRLNAYNPFISLIEKNNNFKTVWTLDRHGQWSKVEQVKLIHNKPMWMSIIHMENKENKFYGYGDINWSAINGFNLNQGILENLQPNIIPFRKWKYLSLKNKYKTHWKVGFKILRRKLGVNV